MKSNFSLKSHSSSASSISKRQLAGTPSRQRTCNQWAGSTYNSGWMALKSVPSTWAKGYCCANSIAQIPVPVLAIVRKFWGERALNTSHQLQNQEHAEGSGRLVQDRVVLLKLCPSLHVEYLSCISPGLSCYQVFLVLPGNNETRLEIEANKSQPTTVDWPRHLAMDILKSQRLKL